MSSEKVKALRSNFIMNLPIEEKEKKVMIFLVKKLLKSSLPLDEKVALGYILKQVTEKGISLQELATNIGVSTSELSRVVRTYEKRSDLVEKAKEKIDKIYNFYCKEESS